MGSKLFPGVCRKKALKVLRALLVELEVPSAEKYRHRDCCSCVVLVQSLHICVCRTHDWRRGHARDMARGGSRLWEILKAGDWRSPAFLKYLDAQELESGAVAEVHELGELSDSDEDVC